MKPITTLLLIGSFIAGSSSCSNNKPSEQDHSGHTMAKPAADSTNTGTAVNEQAVKNITPLFKSADKPVLVYMHAVVTSYLAIKNALVSDNAAKAGSAARDMYNTMRAFDKSLLTAEQLKSYQDYEGDLLENAEHISKNADKIDHQRSHFATMSEEIYNLVTAFGYTKPLYHDHCPMARNKQGAIWLSETREVKNPYFGSGMLTCGSVEEVIQ